MRAAAETGGSTGAATVVLALLSAGALAGLGMVGAGQLTPSPPRQPPAGAQVVEPPASVVVSLPRPSPGPTTPVVPPTSAPTPSQTVGVTVTVTVRPTVAAPPSPSAPAPAPTAGPPAPSVLPGPTVAVPGPDDTGVLGTKTGKPTQPARAASRPRAVSVSVAPCGSPMPPKAAAGGKCRPAVTGTPRGYGVGQGHLHLDRADKPGNGGVPVGRRLL